MKTQYSLIFFIFLLCASCNYKEQKHPNYTYDENGYYYQLLSFREQGRKVQAFNYVQADIYFFNQSGDSIIASEQFEIQIKPRYSACLPDMLLHAQKGDSISFISPNSACIRSVLVPEFSEMLAKEENLPFTITVHSVLSEQEYQTKQEQYRLWLENKQEFEHNTIKDYIANHRYSFTDTNGIFKYTIHQSLGEQPQENDLITISYQGSLLGGEIINHFTMMEYVYGTEWQVVEGIDRALQTMREGERALIIVPSEYAWGRNGSTNNLIKPFTTIVFDLELVSIEKEEDMQKNTIY
ncbi:MAG: FKBP-type peptidyl-prolyl cis-trans isomerase [Bacteroidales bacterium]|jgi:FKBP-type peptidyl-prolyl cis-trans isomerase FkpA|nr:FKBP-type peptidyl-prolyl cis-trans isomerase [Bacteroidales bacterium]